MEQQQPISSEQTKAVYFIYSLSLSRHKIASRDFKRSSSLSHDQHEEDDERISRGVRGVLNIESVRSSFPLLVENSLFCLQKVLHRDNPSSGSEGVDSSSRTYGFDVSPTILVSFHIGS